MVIYIYRYVSDNPSSVDSYSYNASYSCITSSGDPELLSSSGEHGWYRDPNSGHEVIYSYTSSIAFDDSNKRYMITDNFSSADTRQVTLNY